MEALLYLVPLAGFVAFYGWSLRRARREGTADPQANRWLLVVLACAGVAVLVGVLAR